MLKSRKRRVVRSLTRVHTTPHSGHSVAVPVSEQAISIVDFVTCTPVTATAGKSSKSV